MKTADGSSNGDGRPSLFLMTNTLETGGSERQFALLASALDPRHLEVRLGCLGKIGRFAEGLKGIVEFRPEGSLFKPRAQRTRLALRHYLKANHVVIAHSFDFYANFMMIPAARLARVPIVIGSQRQLGDLLGRFRNRAQNALFRWCDRVVANSRAAAAQLQRAGVSGAKVVVIANALPGEAFVETAAALPAIVDGVRVAMIARMNDAAKRHDVFLKAAARLTAKHPRMEFVLVGDGPLRAGLEEMAASLGLGRRVIFLGERRDVAAVLASSQISVLPSDSESLSNVIMESMAAGVPVVACRVGGNEELICDGENGFLVEAGNDGELAERIGRLAGDGGMRRLFGGVGKKIAQSYTLEKICGEYERLYASLLEAKGIEGLQLVLRGEAGGA